MNMSETREARKIIIHNPGLNGLKASLSDLAKVNIVPKPKKEIQVDVKSEEPKEPPKNPGQINWRNAYTKEVSDQIGAMIIKLFNEGTDRFTIAEKIRAMGFRSAYNYEFNYQTVASWEHRLGLSRRGENARRKMLARAEKAEKKAEPAPIRKPQPPNPPEIETHPPAAAKREQFALEVMRLDNMTAESKLKILSVLLEMK